MIVTRVYAVSRFRKKKLGAISPSPLFQACVLPVVFCTFFFFFSARVRSEIANPTLPCRDAAHNAVHEDAYTMQTWTDGKRFPTKFERCQNSVVLWADPIIMSHCCIASVWAVLVYSYVIREYLDSSWELLWKCNCATFTPTKLVPFCRLGFESLMDKNIPGRLSLSAAI